MKYYARMTDDTVAEIVKVKSGDSLEDLFHPDLLTTMVEVSSSVKPGWIRSGSEFSAPEEFVLTKEALLSYAAQRRWRAEIGGMDFGGSQVATDENSQTKVMGARIRATSDSNFTTPWFLPDGSMVELGAAQIIALSDAIFNHVQATFVKRAEVVAKIESGDITTIAQINEEFA